jgi:predicted nucleic acid-binding protein
MLAPNRPIVIPVTVQRELRAGSTTHPALALVLEQEWIQIRDLTTEAELEAFARYSRRLVGDTGRNLGECGVLALAEVHGFVPVIDDGPACKAAKEYGVEPRRTLGLLCEAVTDGKLPLELVSSVADDLLATEYRIPMEPGGFAKWAAENGLLPNGGHLKEP